MSERSKEIIAGVEGALPGETATARAAHASLKGEKRGLARLWPFLGPAFIAAVAYVDPGNFATNIAGGAQFGYLLLWVILTSNLMAMLIQSMSAKLGIATGKNLPEVCRERFPRAVTLGLWVQAEVIAMATDLAGDQRPGRRDRSSLRLPDVLRPTGGRPHPRRAIHAAVRGHGERAAGCRDTRSDGHAARHLPALGPHTA